MFLCFLHHQLPANPISHQLSRRECFYLLVEYLEAQNTSRNECPPTFRIDQVKHDDRLVRFYTGFITYRIFLAFFNFLGPVVNNLQYWGSKEGARVRNRKRKLDPENQPFLALVKLRLNLMTKDLAFRFGLSTAQISRYLTTWICFLYHHIKELDWMPSVQQVAGTLPCVFKEKFPNTFVLLMAVRFSLKHQQTYKCSHQPGASTSTTILQSF